MVIEPAGRDAAAPAGQKDAGKGAANVAPTTRPAEKASADAAASANIAGEVSDVTLDEELVNRAVKQWEQVVGPKAAALREAAQAHYDAINALRREQQRLIDEADRIQRAIDRLERQYQDMTTPQPELEGNDGGEAAAPDATLPEQPR
jgi:chromosome segregation ATPase